MSMIEKTVKLVAALFVLLCLVALATWYQTRKNLLRYCREVTAGTSLVSAKEKASQSGFRFSNYSSADHKALVTSSGVMGRYVCEIEHDGKLVVKTRINFND
ncbi:MAG: hypothetical protein PHP95_01130 [Desulfuromonadaceae bacterium]|nr:hypothetical protein [Desulfuromonadaceae bacterium]MDD2847035.1 hypothetical protein [Desulfuromonadaceae bacterium]MDD4128987.1 hypothetical protein [Desulfuromonadaceae bacterium]